VVEVLTSGPQPAELQSLAQPGNVIKAFIAEVLTTAMIWKKIDATVQLTSDRRGVRWQLSNIRVLL
jgi:hypothetical protein